MWTIHLLLKNYTQKQLDPLPKTLPLVRASPQEQTDDLRKTLLMLLFVGMTAQDFLQRVLVMGHVGAQRETSCEHLY